MHDPLTTEPVTVRAGVVRVLADAGIDAVFGMPGGHTGVLYDALFDEQDRIRAVLVREESIAGIMAQVYGRLTGRPGVAIGQAAFMLSASAGALEARLSSWPMLLLTDLSVEAHAAHLGSYQSGSGEYGSWDARAAFAAFTSRVLVAQGGAQTVHATQMAVRHATEGAGGSVTVIYPREAIRGRFTSDDLPALHSGTATPDSGVPVAGVSRLAALLRSAARPVLIAGGGVHRSRAYAALAAVAEQTGAAVVTTAGGKSAIPETHPLALGVFGTFGTTAANAAVAGADLLVAIATRLAPSDTANANPALISPGRQTLAQIDVEGRNLGWTVPVDLALLGDATAVLAELVEQLATEPMPAAGVTARTAHIADIRHAHPWDDEPGLVADTEPLSPLRVIAELSRTLPDDAFVTGDAGENRIFLTRWFRSRAAGTFIQAAGIGTMGYAIPAALAAKLVHPDRPAVAVCGDGGFAMTLNGLMTAIEEHLPIVVVVLDNAALGWVVHGQRERPIASSFGDFDLAAIAAAIGCAAHTVRTATELDTALAAALATTDRPTVLDCRVSMDVTYDDATSPLARSAPRRVGR